MPDASPGDSATRVDDSAAPTKILSQQDFDAFRAEHRRALHAKLESLSTTFPSGNEASSVLISATEATTQLLVRQMCTIVEGFQYAMGYIEYLLYARLEAAVGEVLPSEDFDEFMKYHNKRIFRSAYSPRPFCHSIRRPDHAPEGLVALEQASADAPGGYEPLLTMTCCVADGAFPARHGS